MTNIRSFSALLTASIISCTLLHTPGLAAPDANAAKLVQWNVKCEVGFGFSSTAFRPKPNLPTFGSAQKQLRANPSNPKFEFALAEVLSSQKKHSEAKPHYAKAAELFRAAKAKRKLSAAEVVGYARSLDKLDKTAEALKLANAALSSAGTDAILIHRFLGSTYTEQIMPVMWGMENVKSAAEFVAAGQRLKSDPAAMKMNESKAVECAQKARKHLDIVLKSPKATAEDYYNRGTVDVALQMAMMMAKAAANEEADDEEKQAMFSSTLASFDSPYVRKAIAMSNDPQAKVNQTLYDMFKKIGPAMASGDPASQWPPEAQQAIADEKKTLKDLIASAKTPPAAAYDALAALGMATDEKKEDVEQLACKALDLDPTQSNSFAIFVAQRVRDCTDLDEAIRRSKLKVSADHSEFGYRMLITAYARSGKLAQAASALKEAEKLGADQEKKSEFDFIRANLLILQNKPDQAIKPLQSVIESDKDNTAAPVINLAIAYYMQGMSVNAAQQLEIAEPRASTEGKTAIDELRALMQKS